MKSNSEILEEVNKTSIKLILEEPFYGHFFMGLVKTVDESTPTMAVSLRGKNSLYLLVNPEFWESMSQEERYGVVKHEILHILFKHLFMMDQFGNKYVFNIAADMLINQYILRKQLPEGGVFLEKFPDLNLDREQTVKYYYDKLTKFIQEQQSIDAKYKPQEGEQDQNEDGQGQQGQGDGESDSSDNSDSKGDNQSKRPYNESWENLKPYLDPMHDAQRRHELWDQIKDMSSAERDIIEGALNDYIKGTVERLKSYGTLPAGIQSYIDNLLEMMKPNLDWKRALRLFTENSRSTYLNNTLKRASKRYGTVPGIKIRRRQKILVAVDTSGSVSDTDLKEFFSEMYYVWRENAEIIVVECDTDIQHVYHYNGTMPDFVHGRGGTDFNAPIRYANEKVKPDAIVYFTDGYAPIPHEPNRHPILWMICSTGIPEDDETFFEFPGRVVKMSATKQ
ncbi:MAG: hypothetical protein GY827_07335 [Cytophagales bacterium]|nr:hypothetical protein [Cytophagales bacterium]